MKVQLTFLFQKHTRASVGGICAGDLAVAIAVMDIQHRTVGKVKHTLAGSCGNTVAVQTDGEGGAIQQVLPCQLHRLGQNDIAGGRQCACSVPFGPALSLVLADSLLQYRRFLLHNDLLCPFCNGANRQHSAYHCQAQQHGQNPLFHKLSSRSLRLIGDVCIKLCIKDFLSFHFSGTR